MFKFTDGAEDIHQQRPYDLSEFSPALSNSGLKVIEALSWFDSRPYNKVSNRLICATQSNF
jgi:hypothetical protein